MLQDLDIGEVLDNNEESKDEKNESNNNKKEKGKNTSGSSSMDGLKSDDIENLEKNQENKDNSNGKGDSQNQSLNSEGVTNNQQNQNQEQENKLNKRKMEAPNPFRQLGDINKRWENKLNMKNDKDDESNNNEIEEIEENNDNQNKNNQKSDLYEYEHKNNSFDENNEVGMQVLAEANENEAVHLNNENDQMNNINDNENNEENEDDDGDNDENNLNNNNKNNSESYQNEKKRERENDEDDMNDSNSKLLNEEKQKLKKSKYSNKQENEDEKNYNDQFDEDDKEEEENMNDNLTKIFDKKQNENENNQLEQGKLINNSDSWLINTQLNKSNLIDTEEKENIEDEDELMIISEINEAINNMKNIDENRLKLGQEQWLQLSAQYQSSCTRLCEQLRLVLEPTLASRLQGDYRTGKRISMRRVIGYVASGFRKDKIWLRRTKPYKREYQVMVMIDDSKSMGEAGPLAMASLNVLSGALTRLEVGHIGVCSFVENISSLHQFHQPFNESSGAKILSHFNFNSSQTKLASTLNAVLPLFDESKLISNNSSSTIPVQLCFIISDARINSDNREKLTKIVREMAEKHILSVLIIIDKNEDEKDSIFATKSVEFTSTGIITKSYLDDFPFPYYVAIQQIDSLPEILVGVLKKWLELIRVELDNH